MTKSTKKICLTDGCEKAVKARGLCSTCYRRAVYRGDVIPGTATSSWQHRLSNIDEINKTATCSSCGDVKIFPRERNKGWRCSVLSNSNKRFHDNRKRKVRNTKMLDHCEICGLSDNLRWDHNHTTGLFRGTLCNNCNIAIGHFKDNPDLCVRASEYLKRDNECQNGL